VHPFLLRLRPQPPGLLQEQRREAILRPQIHLCDRPKQTLCREGRGSLRVRRVVGDIGVRRRRTARRSPAAGRDWTRLGDSGGDLGREVEDASPRFGSFCFVMDWIIDFSWVSVSVSNSFWAVW
jgi:hypothetical protein